MKRLVVLSLLVCALNSALAFAERWVPIQIGGMTTYVNAVDFRATQALGLELTRCALPYLWLVFRNRSQALVFLRHGPRHHQTFKTAQHQQIQPKHHPLN